MVAVKPYYSDDHVTIYHGDCLELADLWTCADVLVTDPPYGIDYDSGSRRSVLAASIAGDKDTAARDGALEAWHGRNYAVCRAALVFGTWRRPYPAGTRALLVWDTKGALGMGDLSIPWKPSHQEVYVLGLGFSGHRTTDVLTFAPVQSTSAGGRTHPHEKPVDLLRELIQKCPPGVIADPFMGSGTTLRAAKDLGRKAIGIEIEERYCEIAAKRLAQAVLPGMEVA